MILALETSTPRASLAVVSIDGGETLWESEFETDRAHNSVIFGPVSEALERYRDQIQGIAVGLGPGSYSGVRVGIAVANGLGLALDRPTRGVSSLGAFGESGSRRFVVGDARRRTFFFAEVSEGGGVSGEPELLDEEALRERLDGIGDEAPVFSADRSVFERFERIKEAYPTARRIGGIAARVEPGQWPRAVALEPHYLRAPYITTPRKRG